MAGSFLDADRWRWLGVEFLVIVLGVLSALFVDTWLEERQDAERAALYRDRLISDLETDVSNLRFQQDYLDRVRAFGLLLLADLEGQQPLDDAAFLFVAFNAAEEIGFTVQSSTFDDMESTGMMRLFEDVQLRLSLADYYRTSDNRQQFWNLDREYRRMARGIIPNGLQMAIHERCRDYPRTGSDELPSGLSISSAELIPAYADATERCGIPDDLVDATGPAGRIRASQALEDELRYRVSQTRVAIRLFEVQQRMAEALLAQLRGSD